MMTPRKHRVHPSAERKIPLKGGRATASGGNAEKPAVFSLGVMKRNAADASLHQEGQLSGDPPIFDPPRSPATGSIDRNMRTPELWPFLDFGFPTQRRWETDETS